ncbi:hypothetical protein Bhyg_09616 [Pseudolycoriella hygida]|uniref:Single domain-containing protein n=1 Tax=Pseudolycoriella hygida TaxID=35572 RepID=A0A9Q0N6V8_9DIPT|nr:hypothetical protein Bhyg_09616 [Pseudolycoriella hygida]
MLLKSIMCLFILGFVCSAYGAQYHTQSYQHPDYPGQCYDKEINEPVPVGKTSSNRMGCKWQECQPDFSFAVSSCAPVGEPKGCKATEPDFSKEYPKCCPQLICS